MDRVKDVHIKIRIIHELHNTKTYYTYLNIVSYFTVIKTLIFVCYCFHLYL